jgi:hypothetical protein
MQIDFLIKLVVGFAILTLVMLLLRELYCWYWKINRIIQLLQGIRDDLGALKQSGAPASSPMGRMDELCRELQSPDAAVRERAVSALGDMGAAGAAALTDLERLRNDPSMKVRSRASWAIETIIRAQLRAAQEGEISR